MCQNPTDGTINNGQSINLTANPSGGTTPYSYQWYADGTCTRVILGETSATFLASPSTNTTYSYKVTDSAYSHVSQCSAGDTVIVNTNASVGGVVLPIDKLALLAPYISPLAVLIAVAGTLTYLRLKRKRRAFKLAG